MWRFKSAFEGSVFEKLSMQIYIYDCISLVQSTLVRRTFWDDYARLCETSLNHACKSVRYTHDGVYTRSNWDHQLVEMHTTLHFVVLPSFLSSHPSRVCIPSPRAIYLAGLVSSSTRKILFQTRLTIHYIRV
ncbi:uncharacterized protein LOC109611385 isoform X1 [Ooceraea biroi]|uniref:uncharacterized protein LOC109611385 isoform X1 n=1 Tax=Ooceraea biroi TaxID=2015173 RepID=UPI0009715DC7|nr:uncharacterized protein LOC109611385 isoform X1 [Ooceraea biroi]